MSKVANREPQLIRIDFAVLPETECQGLFNQFTKSSQFGALADFVAEQTHDFVAHGFPAVRVEVDFNLVGGLADTLHKVGLFGFRGGADVFFGSHIIIFLSGLLLPSQLQ
jgi:hypothetical protein